jgi:hypothetical protein
MKENSNDEIYRFFKLKHPVGSTEETDFLKEAMTLAELPGVHNFSCVKQLSKKRNSTMDGSWILKMTKPPCVTVSLRKATYSYIFAPSCGTYHGIGNKLGDAFSIGKGIK